MRDPKRIEVIMNKLEKIWKKHPDMRFCQMFSNILLEDEIPYYLEDDTLLKKIEIFEKMLALINK